MAKVVYPKARTAFGKAQIDVLNDDVKVVLVDLADYTYSAAHEFLSDIPVGARVSTSGNLAGKTFGTVAEGTFDANDTTFPNASGDQSEAMVGFQDTGVEGTSRLIWFDDAASGLPITPNGQDINVSWDAGGIFNI